MNLLSRYKIYRPQVIRLVQTEISGTDEQWSNFEVLVLYLNISIFCYFVLLLHYNSEVNIVLLLHYFYLIPLVSSQVWINDKEKNIYNQHLKWTYHAILE